MSLKNSEALRAIGAPSAKTALLALLKRLHFTIGLFIGPFIFIAALTGTLYVLTPQIEDYLYAGELFTPSRGEAHPLAAQIDAALAVTGPDAKISAVRPAPTVGETTRVMFAEPGLAASETRSVFIDPVTLQVRGDMTVYGTSGILPFRTWLNNMHRGLLLGDLGRIYSELAASWLWVAALGGLALWWVSRGEQQPAVRKLRRQGRQLKRGRRWHTLLGLSLLLGLMFFSATGLTWSQWAGSNIDQVRAAVGWLSPSLNTSLMAYPSPAAADPHAEHHVGMEMTAEPANSHLSGLAESFGETHHPQSARTLDSGVLPMKFDDVVRIARQAGLSADKIEIKPTYAAAQAWSVNEIDRRWPTQIDAISINPQTLAVVDHLYFEHYPLIAKLIRWGIDAHMGILFGVANQILLAAFGSSVCAMIAWGYYLWWLRRPRSGSEPHPLLTLTHEWKQLPASAKLAIEIPVLILAITLPVMGFSLILIVVSDYIRWKLSRSHH
ncbi:PepSY-associated TM helix domain-containing protein [Biostraticola tofi]|nr:PepSY-associated TM helix domain-containing protein [Biostraticola tofi]